MTIKERIRQWLFPELDHILEIVPEIHAAKEKTLAEKETLEFDRQLILVGSLHNCKVDLKPTITPEITLAQVDVAALLAVSGQKQMVTGSYFSSQKDQAKVGQLKSKHSK